MLKCGCCLIGLADFDQPGVAPVRAEKFRVDYLLLRCRANGKVRSFFRNRLAGRARYFWACDTAYHVAIR